MKKILESCNSVGAGAHKIGKVVSLWPNFNPNFKKGKLHLLKKVGLSTFKEIF